jgi:hypothetical protein
MWLMRALTLDPSMCSTFKLWSSGALQHHHSMLQWQVLETEPTIRSLCQLSASMPYRLFCLPCATIPTYQVYFNVLDLSCQDTKS